MLKLHGLNPKQICPSTLALCEGFAVIDDSRRKQAVRHRSLTDEEDGKSNHFLERSLRIRVTIRGMTEKLA